MPNNLIRRVIVKRNIKQQSKEKSKMTAVQGQPCKPRFPQSLGRKRNPTRHGPSTLREHSCLNQMMKHPCGPTLIPGNSILVQATIRLCILLSQFLNISPFFTLSWVRNTLSFLLHLESNGGRSKKESVHLEDPNLLGATESVQKT